MKQQQLQHTIKGRFRLKHVIQFTFKMRIKRIQTHSGAVFNNIIITLETIKA